MSMRVKHDFLISAIRVIVGMRGHRNQETRTHKSFCKDTASVNSGCSTLNNCPNHASPHGVFGPAIVVYSISFNYINTSNKFNYTTDNCIYRKRPKSVNRRAYLSTLDLINAHIN